MEFERVKEILDRSIIAWNQEREGPPDLSGHGDRFSWKTKAELMAAVGHGNRLIQPDVIGNGKGNTANLVVVLRTGIPLRMPKGGPYVGESDIQEIEDWINKGCPE